MKKQTFSALLSILFLFLLSESGYGWQGRMAGMGDPFGLVEDESDFLIHPSKIAVGSGIKYYSHYRFSYIDVPEVRFTFKQLTSIETDFVTEQRMLQSSSRISGYDADHDAFLGTSWPLGEGRAGLFLNYNGLRGDFSGKMNGQFVLFLSGQPIQNLLSSGASRYHKQLDSFSLSFFYGLPVNKMRLGGMVELAHRTEENKNLSISNGFFFPISVETNDPSSFMIPFDSRYWETLFKGTLEGPLGEGKLALTLKSGFIFNGDNDLRSTSTFGSFRSSHLKGDVKGWKAGGDLWLRFPFLKDLDLPFVLAMEYERKSRDGKGLEISPDPFRDGNALDYNNKETIFHFTAGGGIDKRFTGENRLASGIYYQFIHTNQTFSNEIKFPDYREHRVILNLTGEKKLSSGTTMRAGLNFFYGWASEEFESKSNISPDRSLDGYRWGMAASLGSTIKFMSFTLEPFLGLGYRRLHLSRNISVPLTFMGQEQIVGIGIEDLGERRREWVTNAGISVTF